MVLRERFNWPGSRLGTVSVDTLQVIMTDRLDDNRVKVRIASPCEMVKDMGSGSQWSNIPSNSDITLMDMMNLLTDDSDLNKLDSDLVWIKVVDMDDGDWWKLAMEFKYQGGDRTIIDLYQRSKASGCTSQSTWQVDGFDIGTSHALTFIESSIINLIEPSYYDHTACLYQNANIGDTNTLITLVGDDTNMKDTALISVTLVVE